MNNASPNDRKHLWQAQETEKMTLQPQQIRERIQRLHKRGRVTNAFLAAVFGLIGIYYAFQAADAPDLLRAIGCALISLGNFYWTYLAVTAIRSSRVPVLAPMSHYGPACNSIGKFLKKRSNEFAAEIDAR